MGLCSEQPFHDGMYLKYESIIKKTRKKSKACPTIMTRERKTSQLLIKLRQFMDPHIDPWTISDMKVGGTKQLWQVLYFFEKVTLTLTSII